MADFLDVEPLSPMVVDCANGDAGHALRVRGMPRPRCFLQFFLSDVPAVSGRPHARARHGRQRLRGGGTLRP